MATDVFGQLALGRDANPYFKALLQQGLDTSPIQSPYQGASRLAMALLAGLEQRDQDQKEKSAGAQLMNLPGLPGAASPAANVAAPPMVASPAASPVASAMTASPETSQPRGIRNNNPLNIEAGAFTQGQPGFAGSDGRFARFETPQQGTDAAGNLIDIYRNKYGLNTVAGIVGRWAPSSDNNPTSNYVNAVAKDLGVDPNQPLDTSNPQIRQSLIMSMGKFENGKPIQMAQAGQSAQQPQPQVLPATNAGAPQPMRSPVQIEPAMAARIQSLLSNPLTRSEGLQLYSQFAKPREETRPLVNAQERARYGIQPTDTNPYQIDAQGKVSAINPQPFAVNVNQQGQSEFEKEYGKGIAGQALGTVEAGDKAVDNIQQVQLVRGLLNDIKTGKLTPGQATIGAWMQSVGMDPKVIGIDANLPATAEAAHALMAKMALSNIGGPGGIPANNFSEADRKFIVNMTAGLSNRPEANEILLDAKERVSQLAMQKADAWAEARANGVSYEKFNSDWRKKLASQNVFGDLIEKANALKEAANPAQQPSRGTTKSGIPWSIQ